MKEAVPSADTSAKPPQSEWDRAGSSFTPYPPKPSLGPLPTPAGRAGRLGAPPCPSAAPRRRPAPPPPCRRWRAGGGPVGAEGSGAGSHVARGAGHPHRRQQRRAGGHIASRRFFQRLSELGRGAGGRRLFPLVCRHAEGGPDGTKAGAGGVSSCLGLWRGSEGKEVEEALGSEGWAPPLGLTAVWGKYGWKAEIERRWSFAPSRCGEG